MRESLSLDPKEVAVDLDNTLFKFIGESESTGTIESAEIIQKTLDLLLLLQAQKYNLSIYTAAFFFRPEYIQRTFPEVYALFRRVFTRESLINDDAPLDSNVSTRQSLLLASPPEKWQQIMVPSDLSEEDYTTIRWVGRNRGKVPALISAATMLDDGRKVRQLGGDDLRVQVIRPNQIPNKDIAIRGFVRTHFP